MSRLLLAIGLIGLAAGPHLHHVAAKRIVPPKPSLEWHSELAPRKPALPIAVAGAGITNPIDLLLRPYLAAHKAAARPLVSDSVFLRRASLDIVGLLPSPAEIRDFIRDSHAGKRARMAATLLAEKDAYAQNWMSFWDDMLRNDYNGTGYIDGGRTQITGWLYSALANNLPYDQFVTQLVKPTPESSGFIKGIVWRGVVNSSQTPEMQAAQNLSQVFMGINLKCASCHNSFISSWKLADAYGLAGVFSEHALEMYRCDKPTGNVAAIKFLYPQLGAINPSAPIATRETKLSAMLTSRSNGRFARTLVNRIWGKLMGRGLVEPTDEMDNQPWDADVLDWLAWDFAHNGYDVKRLIGQIVTSRAYQMPDMNLKSEQNSHFVFAGPVTKRMSAEQFVDAVSSITGEWSQPVQQFRISEGAPALPPGEGEVKFQTPIMKSGAAQVDVDVRGVQALLLMVTDGGSGGAFDWADWAEPTITGPSGEKPLTDLKWSSATTGYGSVEIDKSVVEKPIRIDGKQYAHGIGAHADSIIAYRLPPGTTRFRAIAGPDTGAVEQKNSPTSIRFFVVTGDESLLQARAVLAVADPLTRALGRPNREQVVTERSTTATMLQALELTNGSTLDNMLKEGAARWTQTDGNSPARLVNDLFVRALGRSPSPTEAQACEALIGKPAAQSGVADLLWSVTMLPEFQLY